MRWTPYLKITLAGLLGLGIVLVGSSGCWTSGAAENGNDAEQESAKANSPSANDPNQQQPGVGQSPDKQGAAEPDRPAFDTGDVPPVGSKVELSAEQWKERLGAKAFHILREDGTEPAGSGKYVHNKKDGVYYCAGCGAPLYSSRHKYNSHTGWPSYYQGIEDGRLGTKDDRRMGMVRTEVHCARCGGHLGHIFDDGPPPTGKRHCINSLALEFRPVNSDGVVENPPEPVPSTNSKDNE